eukprot:1470157-Prymnesium_polylepis.2
MSHAVKGTICRSPTVAFNLIDGRSARTHCCCPFASQIFVHRFRSYEKVLELHRSDAAAQKVGRALVIGRVWIGKVGQTAGAVDTANARASHWLHCACPRCFGCTYRARCLGCLAFVSIVAADGIQDKCRERHFHEYVGASIYNIQHAYAAAVTTT